MSRGSGMRWVGEWHVMVGEWHVMVGEWHEMSRGVACDGRGVA